MSPLLSDAGFVKSPTHRRRDDIRGRRSRRKGRRRARLRRRGIPCCAALRLRVLAEQGRDFRGLGRASPPPEAWPDIPGVVDDWDESLAAALETNFVAHLLENHFSKFLTNVGGRHRWGGERPPVPGRARGRGALVPERAKATC